MKKKGQKQNKKDRRQKERKDGKAVLLPLPQPRPALAPPDHDLDGLLFVFAVGDVVYLERAGELGGAQGEVLPLR